MKGLWKEGEKIGTFNSNPNNNDKMMDIVAVYHVTIVSTDL